MGVKGLWQLLAPVGKPISLESLEGKILAVDVSIWLNKATKGMRDKQGNQVYNAHLVLMFHRICKLLFYGIKPVFVFDGSVPDLKKRTLKARKDRRLHAETKKNKTRDTMLKNYMHAKAVEAITGEKSKIKLKLQEETEPDLFQLNPLIASSQSDSSDFDDEMEKEESWLEALRNEHIQNMFDNPETVDIESEGFQLLSPEIQHELLTEIKAFHRKRHRKRREKDHASQPIAFQETDLPENAGDFSKYQLANLRNRGKITHRIDSLRKEMNSSVTSKFLEVYADDFSQNKKKHFDKHHIESKRIASDDRAHYVLIKTKSKEENPLFQSSLDDEYIRFKQRESHLENDEQFQKLERIPARFETIKTNDSKNSTVGVQFFSDDSSDEENDFKQQLVKSERPQQTVEKDNDKIAEESIISDHQMVNTVKDEVEFMSTSSDSDDSVVVVKPESFFVQKEQTQNADDLKHHLEDSVNSPIDNREISASPVNYKNPTTGEESKNRDDSNINTHELDTQLNVVSEENIVKINEKTFPSKEMIQTIPSQLLPTDQNSFVAEISENVVEPSPNKDLQNSSAIFNKTDLTLNIESTKESIYQPIIKQPNTITKKLVNEQSNKLDTTSIIDAIAVQKDLENEQEALQKDKQKQTRLAAGVSAEKSKEVQELLHLFGIPYIVSPMEAEAQCAQLDYTNLTDGSVTDDSDIFLFGGKHVYKNIFNQKKYAEIYKAIDIEKSLCLTRRMLVALAFLTGSDYTEGISGVGGVSGMEILHEFAHNNPKETLDGVKEWLLNSSKSEKIFTTSSKIAQTLKRASLPRNFNSTAVWEAYLEPTVEHSEERFEWGAPDVDAIKEFANEKLGWLSSRTEEVLKPVLQKYYHFKKSQKTLESYFTPQPHLQGNNVKSKRLKRILELMSNPDEADIKVMSNPDIELHNPKNVNVGKVQRFNKNMDATKGTRKKNADSDTLQEKTNESIYFQSSSDSSSSPRKKIRFNDTALISTVSSNEKVQAKKVENLKKVAEASTKPPPPFIRINNINNIIQKRLQAGGSASKAKKRTSKRVAAAKAILENLDRPKPLVSSESDSD